MKNSASNPSTEKACAKHASIERRSSKQALQTQAQKILPVLTNLFSSLHYSQIAHQRLSQQSDSGEANYQGLTRSQHAQFGQVMIKWQLSADSNKKSADLAYEADVLKSINISISENSLPAIAPPILAYDNVTIQILKPSSQLTILVTPYYPNGSLASQLNSQNHSRLTDVQKHHFIVQSALLVAKLHNIGWLHNDIKPSNILLDGFMPNHADNSSIVPDLLLTDFALAEAINDDIAQNSDKDSTGDSAGTPAYLAPERWQGQGATLQSDIYAFGIMMYETLTGERPFNIDNQSGEPLREWAIQHCQQPVPTLPLEYSGYQGIIDKALAKRVERRYQSMEDIVVDLERL
ncbi:serine/threonine-protein kinase [Psychrobacter sp. APC 3426]|uniref:serine/threonine-protein kinase n=1 Tax=Psychrobacter sp. APC 3426 TaxID=3035177 RepID=UPI0025B41261|nr:serine/threonine-protein kinase [Psychrobacter sp. APC 3426]MDN3397578.1 serine/threonine-protein kinase [Psychrobacter sp. APC 3426]